MAFLQELQSVLNAALVTTSGVAFAQTMKPPGTEYPPMGAEVPRSSNSDTVACSRPWFFLIALITGTVNRLTSQVSKVAQ